MSRFLERFSLRAILAAGFGLVIVLGVVSAGTLGAAWYTVVQATNRYLGEEGRIAQLANEARRGMERARRLEKDFLLYHGELGFQEARSRYATRLQSGLAEVRDATAEIRTLSKLPATVQQTVEIDRALSGFESGFLDTIELYGRLEAPRTGLASRLRGLGERLEAQLARERAGHRLYDAYLDMARAEAEFRDYPRRRVADAFLDAERRFAAPASPRLRALGAEYRDTFLEYAHIAYATRNARDSYLKAAQVVEPMLEEIFVRQNTAAAAARTRINQLSQLVQWWAAAVFVATLALAGAVAWWLSRTVALSTRSLMEFSRKVAAGTLDAAPPARGALEFRALNASFTAMTRALREARDDQQEKTAQLEAANRKLSELATRDPLTGLANRRQFLEKGNELCALARRYGRELSVLMIDVDHFKSVNDRFGHPAGDDVLRFLAAAMPLELRATDLCARLGGEEFAVLLPETSAAEAALTAERVRAAIERSAIPVDGAAQPLRVTISIGVAAYPGPASSLRELLAQADRLLYEAKQGGRNRVAGHPGATRSNLPSKSAA